MGRIRRCAPGARSTTIIDLARLPRETMCRPSRARIFGSLRTQGDRMDYSHNTAGMKLIRGDTFLMGSNAHYEDERPVRRVRVADFWMDATPVTNGQFAHFVAATSYVSLLNCPRIPWTIPVSCRRWLGPAHWFSCPR
jgi:formylglycine-generating enzyme required for sulfatase activity